MCYLVFYFETCSVCKTGQGMCGERAVQALSGSQIQINLPSDNLTQP